MVTSVLHRSLGPRVEKALLPNPSSLTPYDVRHAAWKEEQEKRGRTVSSPGQFENRSPVTDWDRTRKKREIVVKKKIRKLNLKKYRKKRKNYRRLKVRMVDGRRTLVTYNLKAIPYVVCFQNIHLSEYAGKEDLLNLLCRLRKGQILSVSNHILQKYLLRKWWQLWSESIKKLVHVRWLTRKFWRKKMLRFVEGLVRSEEPFNEISARLYQFYYHKITTFSLVKMAIRRGWIRRPRAQPRRPPKNY